MWQDFEVATKGMNGKSETVLIYYAGRIRLNKDDDIDP